MKRFAFANTDREMGSDVVILGVPDEYGGRSYRKGSSKGPDRIRLVSEEREVFRRMGKRIVSAAQTGIIRKKIYDRGDVKRKNVASVVENIVKSDRLVVTFGGDHSVTSDILSGIDRVKKKVSVVYFDAHPDFVCSSSHYYGSVMCDVEKYKNVDFASSVEIGMRQPEPEELANIRKNHLKMISPLEIERDGVERTVSRIKKIINKNFYISVDMDVIDPAFAPGVSNPVPGGISSLQMIYILKELAKLGPIGLDVVEVCPRYDVNDMTSHLAGRIVAETISSLG